jgi:hypothetical protein
MVAMSTLKCKLYNIFYRVKSKSIPAPSLRKISVGTYKK